MAEMERLLALDPLNSLFQCFYGQSLVFRRRSDDAIVQLRNVVRTEPNMVLAHGLLWFAFHQKGMYEEALAEAKEHFSLQGFGELEEALDRGYAQGGYAEAMRFAADTLVARSERSYVQAQWIAQLYAHAGEKDRALDWLEKAYQERESRLVYLGVFPVWDSLRDDPRFRDLLSRMNLPEG